MADRPADGPGHGPLSLSLKAACGRVRSTRLKSLAAGGAPCRVLRALGLKSSALGLSATAVESTISFWPCPQHSGLGLSGRLGLGHIDFGGQHAFRLAWESLLALWTVFLAMVGHNFFAAVWSKSPLSTAGWGLLWPADSGVAWPYGAVTATWSGPARLSRAMASISIPHQSSSTRDNSPTR